MCCECENEAEQRKRLSYLLSRLEAGVHLWLLEPLALTCSVKVIRFIFRSLHTATMAILSLKQYKNVGVRSEEKSLETRSEKQKILVMQHAINHTTDSKHMEVLPLFPLLFFSSTLFFCHNRFILVYIYVFVWACRSCSFFFFCSTPVGMWQPAPEPLTYNPLTVILIPPHLISYICLCMSRAHSPR